MTVEQGFYAKAIPGEEEPGTAGIVNGEGEHTGKAFKAVDTPLQVGAKKDLGIGFRLENMTMRYQLVPEVTVVEYFTVKDKYCAGHIVDKRLMSAVEINDGKTPMPQHYARRRVDSGVVRAAIGHCRHSGMNSLYWRIWLALCVEKSYNSTHYPTGNQQLWAMFSDPNMACVLAGTGP